MPTIVHRTPAPPGTVLARAGADTSTVTDAGSQTVLSTVPKVGADSAAATQTGSVAAVSQTVTTKMGVPDNGNPHGYTNWDVWRLYTYGAAAGVVSRGAKVIALTDTGTATGGGAASATKLQNHLLNFYGQTGTPTTNATIETHWANGNETDVNDTANVAYANTYELMWAVIQDFPMASLWIDATANAVRNGITATFLDVQASSGATVASMLDGYAASYYAPGRNDYPNMTANSYTGTGTGGSAPSRIVDPHVAAAASRGILRMAIWEFGMPPLVTPPIGWPNEGSTIRNDVRRRDYVQEYINYWFTACLANGLVPEVATYWDQQTGGGGAAGYDNPNNTAPANRFVLDTALITPNTATIWHDAPTLYVP